MAHDNIQSKLGSLLGSQMAAAWIDALLEPGSAMIRKGWKSAHGFSGDATNAGWHSKSELRYGFITFEYLTRQGYEDFISVLYAGNIQLMTRLDSMDSDSPMVSGRSATHALFVYLRWWQQRYGVYPRTLRLSRRTILQLCAEHRLPTSLPRYVLFGIPIEQIDDA